MSESTRTMQGRMRLEAFQRYRDGLLGRIPPVPPRARHGGGLRTQRFDLMVWLQGGWETVLGAHQLNLTMSFHAPVLILGDDERIHEERAPSVAEMRSLLAQRRQVDILHATNTREQAEAFWRYVGGTLAPAGPGRVQRVQVVCAHWHLVRASLTFGAAGDVTFPPLAGSVDLYWSPIVGVQDEARDREELEKIGVYAAKGDCFALPA